MKIGILTRNPRAWCSNKLRMAIQERNIEPICFNFSDIIARVACKPEITVDSEFDVLKELDALIIRPIGRGSLDEIIFRMDLLHRLERLGLPIFNPPSSIERAVDKYYVLTILEEQGIRVPRTIVTESYRKATEAFYELGQDVVVKPIFGSRGMGITRVSDPEIAGRIFRSLAYVHHVLYIQEFIHHGNRDIRAFVVGDRIISAMYRIAQGWKTNVSQGANPVPLEPTKELEDLAVRATKAIGCEIAGVDIMEGPEGYVINEINSQPGFRGLQQVTKVDIAGEIIDYITDKISP